MNALTELLASAARTPEDAASTDPFTGTKPVAVIVTVSEMDPGASLDITLTDGTDPLLSFPSPIDHVGQHILTYGSGTAVPGAAVQGGFTDVSSSFKSRGNATLPDNYGVDFTPNDGSVTFKIEYAKAA